MSSHEGTPQRFETYQPVSTLLENLDSRLQIAPWDRLDIELANTPRVRHIESRQLQSLERILPHLGYTSIEQGNWDSMSLRPFDNYQRGLLHGVDTHVGTVELLVEEKPGMGKAEALLLQYMHNSTDSIDNEGNPEVINDGVANVFLLPDGRIFSFAQLPEANAQQLYYPFSPDYLRKNELAYPTDANEALQNIKAASPRAYSDETFAITWETWETRNCRF